MNEKDNASKKLKRQEVRSISLLSTFDHDMLPTKKAVLLTKSQLLPLIENGMSFKTTKLVALSE